MLDLDMFCLWFPEDFELPNPIKASITIKTQRLLFIDDKDLDKSPQNLD